MTANQPKPTKPFGDVENKSLATSEGLETKTADDTADAGEAPTEPASESSSEATTAVVMLHHGDHDDADLIPGKTYDLPARVAADLIAAQRAIAAE